MNKIQAEIKSGKGFYIGDVCYAVPGNLYHGVWGSQFGYKDGEITDPKTGLKFAVASTAYGDGCYEGNNGECYMVDAGNIGVVPLELVDVTLWKGHIVEQPGTTNFEADGGVFKITLPDGKTIEIDTRDAEE